MKNTFTDQKMDQVLKKLVDDAAFDDAGLDEIADSPQLWWGVQRKIKADVKPFSEWNVGLLGRWLILGAPLTIAALFLFVFLAPKPIEQPVEHVSATPTQPLIEIVNTGPEDKSIENPSSKIPAAKPDERSKGSLNHVKKAIVEKKSPRSQQLKSKTILAKPEPVEVRSEFIALSYARNPDSGQIVRVKVPSSMMVSLGLVSSVEKPSSLVNAEILVGDDGMTHAIRFIR